ncbi:MAG: hypothetical protein WCO44_14500 [Bacteroidota bacterium]
MGNNSQMERETQNRAVPSFQKQLGSRYIGNPGEEENKSNLCETDLIEFMKGHGFGKILNSISNC